MSARGTEECKLIHAGKVKRLQLESRRHQEALIHCVDRIDEHLLRCRNQADEYEKTVSVLVGLNERLANLGEDPVQLSLHVGFSSPGDLILARVEALKVKSEI
jgi:hypothetical protein